MLASPANPILPISEQESVANLLTLQVAGADHDSVLLSPGKWTIGSAASNQIVLKEAGVAARQFLIVVTEHRAIIKDWSGTALRNGNLFDHAVLEDGDRVQVADVELCFRGAQSLDLISQLPCVADNCESGESVESDRLDEMISGIEASLASDRAEETDRASADDSQTVTSIFGQNAETPEHETPIDDELRELEELRAAVRREREELMARREMLARESRKLQAQLDEVSLSVHAASESELSAEARDEDSTLSAESVPADVSDVVDHPSDQAVADAELDEMTPHCLDDAAGADETKVSAERQKLRHFLEEFDSVAEQDDEFEVEEAAEDEDVVVVGATQLLSSNGVSNAMRSRDDAVKRLDELIFAANQSSESVDDFAADADRSETAGLQNSETYHGPSVQHDADHTASGNQFVDGLEEADDESPDEQDETAGDEGGIEASVESLSSLLNEVQWQDVEQTVENDSVHDVDVSKAEEDASAEDQGWEETVEPDLAADDGTEGEMTWQSGRLFSEAEEVSAELSDSADGVSEVIDQEYDASPNDSYGTDAVGEELESAALSDSAELESPEFETSAEHSPSWFESEFMTEDADPAEAELSDDRSEGPVTSAEANSTSSVDADSMASAEDSSAVDLRQKLAEMFDLPDLPNRAESPTLELATGVERHAEDRQFAQQELASGINEVNSEAHSEGMQSSLPEPGADELSPSAADTVQDFESETLDQFPSSTLDVEEDADESTSEMTLNFEPETHDSNDDDESINAYMERLLARNRQATGASSSGYSVTRPENEPASVTRRESDATTSAAVENQSGEGVSASKPEAWFDATPRHRQNRDKVRAEVQVLRQIANQSARSAVATASRRDIRKQVVVKTTASVLALVSGVAALLLDVSMLFGLVVIGIGLLFSADLTLTVLRNWRQTRNLRKAVTVAKDSASPVVDNAHADSAS